MRVEPELPTIPKFQLLKRRVGDHAMEALIRLWAHCQQNQRGEFWPGADAEYIEMVAEWKDGQPGLLFRSLLELRWIEEEEGGIRIHDWEEMNTQIVSNWKNGPKGGRPKKGALSSEKNPVVNHPVTSGPPQPLLGLPAISGAVEKNPVVNPIPISVIQPLTQREPYQRNETKQDVTERTDPNRNGGQGAATGLRYELAGQVIEFLNQQTGAEFKGTRAELEAVAECLRSVGNDVAGVKKMVARQAVLWRGEPKTAAWLQPRTLFDEEKFPGYFAMRNLPTEVVTTDPVARRRELEELIARHPANRASTYHKPDASDAQREELRGLRQELAETFQPKKTAPQKVAASSNA